MNVCKLLILLLGGLSVFDIATQHKEVKVSFGFMCVKLGEMGKVYGEKYQAGLYPRGLKEIVVKDKVIKLSWGTASDSCRVVLSYPDISGKMQFPM